MNKITQDNHLFYGTITYEDCCAALSCYRKKTGHNPFFISGWEVNDNVSLPSLILEQTFPIVRDNMNKYYLVEDDIGRTDVSRYLKNQLGLSIPPNQVLVAGSATSLLCLVLLSLLTDVEKRALILEPAYFSVHDMFNLLGRTPWTVNVSIPKFTYDYNNIEAIIQREKIKVLILTDPIFGSGISIRSEDYNNLVKLANRYHCILVVDMARMGMNWNAIDEPLFGEQLSWICKAEQYAVVYSPCKKVFANGVKTGVLISSASVIKHFESYSDSVLGSVSAAQAEFLITLLSESSHDYISHQMTDNVYQAKNNYDILSTLLHHSDCKLIKPDMGHYALASYPTFGCSERDIFFKLLYEADVYTLPMGLYGFRNHLSYFFRVNLLAEVESLINGMERISTTLKNSVS